jgi:UDP-N-acetylmuramate-alanine ligase
MQTNCTCLAKVVINKRLQTFRIVFSFDQHNRVTVKNAALVTGDICATDYANAPAELAKAIQAAKATLRTNNIVLVD